MLRRGCSISQLTRLSIPQLIFPNTERDAKGGKKGCAADSSFIIVHSCDKIDIRARSLYAICFWRGDFCTYSANCFVLALALHSIHRGFYARIFSSTNWMVKKMEAFGVNLELNVRWLLPCLSKNNVKAVDTDRVTRNIHQSCIYFQSWLTILRHIYFQSQNLAILFHCRRWIEGVRRFWWFPVVKAILRWLISRIINRLLSISVL